LEVLAGYGHFLRIAAAARWDDAAIDLRGDARAWPGLPLEEREPLLDLLAGFCVGEARVAVELEPFARAAGGQAAACLRAQARDEERHACFFDRFAAEVARVPGADPTARRAHLSTRLPERFIELFEVELPAAAQRLTRDGAALAAAIGLYHMLLEGVVFAAGQSALLERLRRLGALPGLVLGLERVMRDERWHIGLGARCLVDAGTRPGEVERLLALGERCARAWESAVPETLVAETVRLHGRRLRAAGLTGDAVAA
jgi:ribonucleoside-diphosphate reductase beta chain